MEPAKIIERSGNLTDQLITARNDRKLIEKLIKEEMYAHRTPMTYMAVLFGSLGSMTIAFADAIQHIEEHAQAPGSFDAIRIEELLNRQQQKD